MAVMSDPLTAFVLQIPICSQLPGSMTEVMGHQQTDGYEPSSWESHPRRVRRRPRLSGYGSIIVTVTCHRSPRRVISQSWHKEQPRSRGVLCYCGLQAHHLAITAKYLLKDIQLSMSKNSIRFFEWVWRRS